MRYKAVMIIAPGSLLLTCCSEMQIANWSSRIFHTGFIVTKYDSFHGMLSIGALLRKAFKTAKCHKV